MTLEAQFTLETIGLDDITVEEGHNPRRTFDAAALQTLATSIEQQGLIQPIAVRRAGAGYSLIAGERRMRALKHLGRAEVEAKVFDVDAETALAMALSENVVRANLGIGEEALAAKQYVSFYQGDHERAAQSLGWSLGKLRNRLALLHASEEVLTSLIEGRIQIGHAELLAALPEATQQVVLARVIESSATVAQLKEQLEGFAIPLALAKFDTAECNTCPHNSSLQSSLFDTSIVEGKCTKRSCFTAKTGAWVAAERERITEDFNVVTLASETDGTKSIVLTRFGEQGVGANQFDTGCAGCALRGAILEDRIGHATGGVTAPVCFNRTCHAERVLENKGEQEQSDDGSPAHNTSGAPARAQTGKRTSSKPQGKPTKKSVTKATPAAITDQYASVLRRGATAAINQDEHVRRAISAYAVACLLESEAGADAMALLGLPKRSGATLHNGEQMITLLLNRDPAELDAAIATALGQLLESCPEQPKRYNGKVNRRSLAAAITKHSGTPLQPFVIVDADFLNAHTRAALANFLDESGFKAWMESREDGVKQYKAILAQGKEMQVKSILSAGFDFSQSLPSGVTELQVELTK